MKRKRKTKAAPSVTLGTWNLGHTVFNVKTGNDANGLFRFPDMSQEDGLSVGLIVVGLDHKYFSEVLEVLLHELFEAAASSLGLRYLPTGNWNTGHDGYLFVFTHPQFTEIQSRVAAFAAAVLPKLKTAWKAYQRKSK